MIKLIDGSSLSKSLPLSNLVTIAYFYPNKSLNYLGLKIGRGAGTFKDWKKLGDNITHVEEGRSKLIKLKNDEVFFEVFFDYARKGGSILNKADKDKIKQLLRDKRIQELMFVGVNSTDLTNRKNVMTFPYNLLLENLALFRMMGIASKGKKFSKEQMSKFLPGIFIRVRMPKDVIPHVSEIMIDISQHKKEVNDFIVSEEFLDKLKVAGLDEYKMLVDIFKGLPKQMEALKELF